MKTLFTEDEIVITASLEKVWNALIDPALTPSYMFGCAVQSNWEVGDTIEWKGVQDGVVYVKGHIVEFDPMKVFAFTVFDPNADYPDVPENYLTARYTLKEQTNGIQMIVTQGDYATVAKGQERYEHTMAQGGWKPVLTALKNMVENG